MDRSHPYRLAGVVVMAAGADRDLVVRLKDGRRLGTAQYGDPAGTPVLYFHGHPGARVEARLLADAATRAGVRLIGVDRPGIGLSDYQPRRSVRDWPDDIAHLADRLGLAEFRVLGFSAGAPYALACAYRLHPRVTVCALVSPAAPVGWPMRWLAGWLPYLLIGVTRRLFANEDRARRSLQRFARRWPPPDRQVLSLPGVANALTASLTQALRRGTRGAARDGVLLGRQWPVPVEDIHLPVLLWHGDLDRQVRAATVHRLATRLPDCRPTSCPHDGHLSTLVRHADQILAALLPPADPRPAAT